MWEVGWFNWQWYKETEKDILFPDKRFMEFWLLNEKKEILILYIILNRMNAFQKRQTTNMILYCAQSTWRLTTVNRFVNLFAYTRLKSCLEKCIGFIWYFNFRYRVIAQLTLGTVIEYLLFLLVMPLAFILCFMCLVVACHIFEMRLVGVHAPRPPLLVCLYELLFGQVDVPQILV